MLPPFQPLATPRRREILRLVWAGELSAGQIHATMADVTFGAVSQHLRVLEQGGLVRARRHGRQRFYRACRQNLGPLRAWLEQMWGDALWRLKLQAEMEEARRGPRSAKGRENGKKRQDQKQQDQKHQERSKAK